MKKAKKHWELSCQKIPRFPSFPRIPSYRYGPHWTRKIGSLNQNISSVMYKTTIARQIRVKIALNVVKASKFVQMKPIT